VELGRQGDASPPAIGAQRTSVEALYQDRPRAGGPLPGHEGGQRRLPAAAGPFEEKKVPGLDPQRGPLQDRFAPALVGEVQVADVQQGPASVGRPRPRGRGN
jgi:hypothetical protein